MRQSKILCLTFFFIFAFITSTFSQTTIWSEDFTYPDGTTQGSGTPPKWTVDISNCSFDGDDHFEVRSNQMQGNDLDGEAVWISESIDISGYPNVSISVDVSEVGGHESSDYVRLYYQLDGGSETMFETNGDNSGDFTSVVASQANLNGSSLVIVIKAKNNANLEFLRFDNVNVQSGQQTLDHFSIDPISNQTLGVPFSITVTAQDAGNATVTNFTGTVDISDLSGTIAPAISGNFISGVWTGNVTITKVYTGDQITVTNSAGTETGTSNSFDVNADFNPSTGDVVINELMWMGSTSSSVDEWIELRNMTGFNIDLSGWQLTRKSSGNEVFMLEITSGSIPANGFFLISNYDEANSQIAVIPDLVDASVSLSNTQLQIKLYDGQWDGGGLLIDTADDGVGAPAAGDNTNKYSMMRTDPPGDGTLPENWFTANLAIGWDTGATEKGTPGSANYRYDFGDAPDPLDQTDGYYPTLLANDCARHIIIEELYLGSTIDHEPDGQPTADADGDDNDGTDDEDGVQQSQLNNLVIGSEPVIEVDVVNTTGKTATVKGWIDYNGNGVFEANESAQNTIAASGKVTLTFPKVPIASVAATFARFRVCTDATDIEYPTGLADDGEVEDYPVTIDIDTDTDGDGIRDYDEGAGDRDGDGIPDNEDYDPSGWIYDETNGNIISGGTISISPSTGVNIIEDGSNGYYQFTVSQNEDYTLSYTPPSGFNLSTACAAQSGTLDIEPTDPNPYVVGAGSKDGTSDKLTNWECGDNIYYWNFHLETGDPVIINNNIPLSAKPTSIELSAFSASVGENGVNIYWRTETEPNNAGFNLYRSLSENGDYQKINPSLIPAQGDATTGAEYSFIDQPGQPATYFYKLEDVSLDGQTKFHGPISVVVTSVDIQQQIIPDQYSLSQNYPNPFNPETSIEFGLPKAQFVKIQIYNINGALVRTLISEQKNAGIHQIKWDALNQSCSGVYFYHIKAIDPVTGVVKFSQTRKMALIK
ncbi:MAG TPA: T9SS type A sorting domain-containing protein [bacterium]|nr:T9SS type A sorting domain-containing protein [bacterium]